MKTGDLTRNHLFARVRIEGPDWVIEGSLRNVEHQGEGEQLMQMGSGKPAREINQSVTVLAVGPFEFTTDGDKAVTLL